MSLADPELSRPQSKHLRVSPSELATVQLPRTQQKARQFDVELPGFREGSELSLDYLGATGQLVVLALFGGAVVDGHRDDDVRDKREETADDRNDRQQC